MKKTQTLYWAQVQTQGQLSLLPGFLSDYLIANLLKEIFLPMYSKHT